MPILDKPMLKVEPYAEEAKVLHMYYLLPQCLLDPAEIYTFANITYFYIKSFRVTHLLSFL